MDINVAGQTSTQYCRHAWRKQGPGPASLLAWALLIAVTADGKPTGADQRAPGLADTPGTQASVPAAALALRDGYPNVDHDLAVLDSDVLLKVYYFANAKVPIDSSAILTQNTENIVSPQPVRPTRTQAQSIEQLVKFAREHRQLLIHASDVALDPYDPVTRIYTISNRLFIPGARYYFDNSAYHYVYRSADAFHSFKVTDNGVIAAINAAISRYEHFSLDIVSHVVDAAAKDSTLQLEVDEVTLKRADGTVLLRQPTGFRTDARATRP